MFEGRVYRPEGFCFFWAKLPKEKNKIPRNRKIEVKRSRLLFRQKDSSHSFINFRTPEYPFIPQFHPPGGSLHRSRCSPPSKKGGSTDLSDGVDPK